MEHKQSVVDRVMSRLKDNPVSATLIVAGLVLASVASFTDSVTKIRDALPSPQVSVTGEWHSEVFVDSSTMRPEPSQYYFQLKAEGSRLYGTVRAVDPPDQPTGRVYGISDGKIDRDNLSWHIEGGWRSTDANGNETPLKEHFFGVVSGDKIRFTYQRAGSVPVEFTANKAAKSKPDPIR